MLQRKVIKCPTSSTHFQKVQEKHLRHLIKERPDKISSMLKSVLRGGFSHKQKERKKCCILTQSGIWVTSQHSQACATPLKMLQICGKASTASGRSWDWDDLYLSKLWYTQHGHKHMDMHFQFTGVAHYWEVNTIKNTTM